MVALTRPGYTDDQGRISEGHTLGRRDNYTPRNIAAVGGAIAALKSHYRPRRVIYLGHSGGAAIGGVLIGKSRGLIDAAVLVSCPCDIPRWLRERHQPAWQRSVSPSLYGPRAVPRSHAVTVDRGRSRHQHVSARRRRTTSNGLRAAASMHASSSVEGAGHGLSGLGAAATKAVDDMLSSLDDDLAHHARARRGSCRRLPGHLAPAGEEAVGACPG